MKVTHNIMPQRSGKTTEINEKYREDKSTFILSKEHVLNPLRGVRVDKIVIDDYIDLSNYACEKYGQLKFNEWMFCVLFNCFNDRNGELILYSTPRKMYKESDLFLASCNIFDNYKERKCKFSDKGIVGFSDKIELLLEIKQMFLGFDINVVKRGKCLLPEFEKEQIKKSIGVERFLTNIEGEYIC